MKAPRVIVALLPLKAHSDRIPGKNFRDFQGKPLFRWMLDTLLSVPEISKVVLNTDARAILAGHGLKESERVMIRDRRPEICGDHTSMNLVIADDVRGVAADLYLMTHVTNPLLSAPTISAALRAYLEAAERGSCDSLFSVTKHQKRFYTKDGRPVNHDPRRLIRTQDLEPWYEENSNLYIFTRDSFAATQARIGQAPLLFETPGLESIDLDEQAEWDLAELILKGRAARPS
ncbi:MAG: acylneuraminate cytidylyltransferase family protein [Elusimicrobia bacterium]|nr:acylneuraminate cytidylyltransferase family protein [Elusimicrobiota bacterium]